MAKCPRCEHDKLHIDVAGPDTVYLECAKCGYAWKTEKCPTCGKTAVLRWTKDRYGIPWKKVCDSCFDKVEADIQRWEHDPADAGEALEEDY